MKRFFFWLLLVLDRLSLWIENMANPFYTPGGQPISASLGRAANLRGEFALIEAGFDAVNVALLTPTFTGNAAISKDTPVFKLNATASGQTAEIVYTTGNLGRWRINKTSDAELGAHTGSNFEINRYSDAGGYLGTVFYASRITGIVAIGTRTLVSGGAKLQTVDGLSFPATAVLSSNETTLDEYREGTWTPALSASGATFNYAADGQLGYYTKVGNLVFFSLIITLAGTGNTLTGNQVTITGLPFTSATQTGRRNAGAAVLTATNTALYGASWTIGSASTTIVLYKVAGAVTSLASLLANDLHDTSGTVIYITGHYYV